MLVSAGLKGRKMHKLDTEQQQLVKLYLELPFNKLLGLEFKSYTEQQELILSLSQQPNLIGNTNKNILHGGVTASAIDATGGLLVLLTGLQRMADKSAEEKQQMLFGTSTVDLRVDYISPGRGEQFDFKAELMRSGSRVSVTRMECHNDARKLIATGSATYLFGR
jgi:uncharacterized protein (TIGR00369 family)